MVRTTFGEHPAIELPNFRCHALVRGSQACHRQKDETGTGFVLGHALQLHWYISTVSISILKAFLLSLMDELE